MQSKFTQICVKIHSNRLKTTIFLAIFATLATFIVQYFFTQSLFNNLLLSLGTGVCAFIIIFILHYFIFQKLRTRLTKYIFLLAFPVVYLVFLISAFGIVTLLFDFILFNVPFINQIYLLTWSFLGKGYIYAAFSPKTPFILTSILVIVSFLCGLKNSHTQTEQD